MGFGKGPKAPPLPEPPPPPPEPAPTTLQQGDRDRAKRLAAGLKQTILTSPNGLVTPAKSAGSGGKTLLGS